MGNQPDIPLLRAAAAALEEQRRALARELQKIARRSRNTEPVRRARVACRRLRTVFVIYRDCFPGRSLKKWRREVRRLGRALGATRDSDVTIITLRKTLKKTTDPAVRPGIRRLLLRQRQHRETLQADIESAVRRIQKPPVLASMALFTRSVGRRKNSEPVITPESSNRVCAICTKRLNALLAFAETVLNPKNSEALHNMRIAAKRLRYAIEILARLLDQDFKPFITTLAELQDRLGKIHDCDVWLALLPKFLVAEARLMRSYLGHIRPVARLAPGIEALRQSRQDQRAAAHAEFLVFWNCLEQSSFWARFRQALSPPGAPGVTPGVHESTHSDQ